VRSILATKLEEFLSIKEFEKRHPSFSQTTLRYYLRDRDQNGLANAVVRHGK
jgi:hypothetical protein